MMMNEDYIPHNYLPSNCTLSLSDNLPDITGDRFWHSFIEHCNSALQAILDMSNDDLARALARLGGVQTPPVALSDYIMNNGDE